MNRNLLLAVLFSWVSLSVPAEAMSNVYGRNCRSLNGKWSAIIDWYDEGEPMRIFEDRKPTGATGRNEYSFEGALHLDVPGDWNSQDPRLEYYEGTVWYARHFKAFPETGKRRFLYFCGVSNRCSVYLNGKRIMSHEGAFTPFQVEVTGALKRGDNFLVVRVNNRREKGALPAMSFDWWDYGGITRDVMLVTVPEIYIRDYFIQLDKHEKDLIHARISLSVHKGGEPLRLDIPELKRSLSMRTDSDGTASVSFRVRNLVRWCPDCPRLYRVTLSSSLDRVSEEIGFRNIEVRGTKVLLNGKPVFLRSVAFHEEIPQRKGRAFSEDDARMLLDEARTLGVNMVRLAHYPPNEYIVRDAERMGIMLWEEIPVWQSIDFTDSSTLSKARRMLSEMIGRDKNRCAVCFWSISNETRDTPARNAFLSCLLRTGKSIDTTRLYTSAFDLAYFDKKAGEFVMHDGFYRNLDMVGINKYMGWYAPWPEAPSDCRWDVAPGKPVFISEFGGGALYGHEGKDTVADDWNEDYQEKLYRDNLRMFGNISNLCGISPWILFDFRSPNRFQPVYQDGWNRKGLVSDRGQRKKAWYVIHDYYMKMKNAAAGRR